MHMLSTAASAVPRSRAALKRLYQEKSNKNQSEFRFTFAIAGFPGRP
jgi:hypothetical protein